MKIVVLAGGTSTERTVSITSGTGICKALRQKGHQAILVDIFCGIENVDWENPFPSEYDVDAASEYMSAFNDRIEQMKKERRSFFGPNVLKLCEAADIVFLGLHGANGEDGKVQATFDLMGIKYTGTGYLSSALAMDKGITKQMFLMNNVPTPRGVSMVKEEMTTDLKALGMEFPVVVKTCCGGSSVGVYIVNDQAGSTIETCPAEISPELTEKMQHYAEAGAKALFMEGYCRLDFMMKENGDMYCLEANTLPGMTPTSLIPQEAKVLGIDYPTLCEKLIEVSMKKYPAQDFTL